MGRYSKVLGVFLLVILGIGVISIRNSKTAYTQEEGKQNVMTDVDKMNHQQALEMLKEGRKIFRYDTFGSEDFWGNTLKLHQAIAGEKNGGVGAGLSPKAALAAGLKVDMDALPADLVAKIKAGQVDLNDPATTLALLKLNAVLGLTGFFDDAGKIKSIGVQCALCHSTVDDAFSPGIGHRLDGWPNRDLNVGAIILMAPKRKAVADRIGISDDELKKALTAWGPGKYDAEIQEDGKAFQPDGKSAAQLLPPAFGLAGVNLHTYTGRGSVTYWNAYVAVTQMHGKGVFFDERLKDKIQFPVAAKNKDYDVRNSPDLVTSKLPALHVYQLALVAPKPPEGSFDTAAAARGEKVFNGKAQCARCHVQPIMTEPGFNMHRAKEIGIDDFQANRSPTKGYYRTTPLRGLFARSKGGFYHDGRFPDLTAVVDHYEKVLKLDLSGTEKKDLVEYLKSL